MHRIPQAPRCVARVIACTMIWVSGCQTEPETQAPPATAEPAPLSEAIPPVEAPTPTLPERLLQLRNIEGEFTLFQNAMWELEGHDEVLASFHDFGEPGLRALVDCLDDLSTTRVALRGQFIPVGTLCGLAIQRMAYATEYEDSDEPWAGVVLPTSTPDQLQRAKAAWLVVLESGRFIIG